MVLAGLALVAVYVDPTQPAKYVEETHLILVCYLAFALAALWADQARRTSSALLVATYPIDLLTVMALMSFTQGVSSPFFVFFTFLLLTAALRWNWRGALLTLVALIVLFLLLGFSAALPNVSKSLNQFILRGADLIIAGAMIAYFGAFRARSRARFAKLAAWPSVVPSSAGKLSLEASLVHAADVLGSSRLLCIWERVGEPHRYFWYLNNGHSEFTHETSELSINALITPQPSAATFVEENGIAPYIREKYHIGAAVIARLSNATCTGFILALEGRKCDDLLPLMTIIANRISAEIEHQWLWGQMQIVAAQQERSRLARNVHDGVLQALTATALNLKVCAKHADQKTREKLDSLRNVLTEEQKRVRKLMGNGHTNIALRIAPRNIDLAANGKRLVVELIACWHCEIPLQVTPKGAKVSADVAGDLDLILAEAVANAAKHGRASKVSINLERHAATLDIHVLDNGRGFPRLSGTYSGEALKVLEPRPHSICERVEEMGGRVTLATSSAGSQLRIQLPV